jgi:hypothetical protein
MLYGSFKVTRTVAAGAIAVGVAVAISSFGVVRAAHESPDKKKTAFSCSSGTACLTAESGGASTYALYASGLSANTIQAETSATNGDSAIAGIATEMSGRAEGVYAASNSGDGLYAITNASGGSGAGYAGVYGLSSTASGVLGRDQFQKSGLCRRRGDRRRHERRFAPGVRLRNGRRLRGRRLRQLKLQRDDYGREGPGEAAKFERAPRP